MVLPLLALFVLTPQTIVLAPIENVWVYSHASDPAHDEYLRVWGAGGKAVPASADDAESFGFSYVKWDVSTAPVGKKLIKAILTVTNIPNPGYNVDQAKAAPLEARFLRPEFDEKSWDYEKLSKVLPSADDKDVFGTGFPGKLETDHSAEIEIDLLKGPRDFTKDLDAAESSTSKQVAIALTSTIDSASIGRSGIYKIYSRHSQSESNHPRLVLVFE